MFIHVNMYEIKNGVEFMLGQDAAAGGRRPVCGSVRRRCAAAPPSGQQANSRAGTAGLPKRC